MVKYILADVTRVEEGHFHLKEILMKPYFIPFSKKVDELLAEMKVKKVHMAIVIDEYGGTAGIVTMEDIMEKSSGISSMNMTRKRKRTSPRFRRVFTALTARLICRT